MECAFLKSSFRLPCQPKRIDSWGKNGSKVTSQEVTVSPVWARHGGGLDQGRRSTTKVPGGWFSTPELGGSLPDAGRDKAVWGTIKPNALDLSTVLEHFLPPPRSVTTTGESFLNCSLFGQDPKGQDLCTQAA